jgi:hypothetical protein
MSNTRFDDERPGAIMNVTDKLANAMATKLLAIVQNCVRPDEWRDAHREFQAVCHKGLIAMRRTAIAKLTQPNTN